MKNYLLLKYLIAPLREYIFIFLTATIFLFISFTKSFAEENIFTINNVKVKGTIDLNFSRDKYLNKAFTKSFDILTTKILLSRDLVKVDDVKLKQIKKMISSFQILEESYRKNEYKASFKIFYNDIKVKSFWEKKIYLFHNRRTYLQFFFPYFLLIMKFKILMKILFTKGGMRLKLKTN